MKQNLSRLILAVGLLLLGVTAADARQPTQTGGPSAAGLFHDTTLQATLTPDLPATIQRSRAVMVDLAPFSDPKGPGAATLALNLFPDANYTALRDGVERNAGSVTWRGHLQGVADSQVT